MFNETGVVLKEFTTFATFIRFFSNMILPMINNLGLVLSGSHSQTGLKNRTEKGFSAWASSDIQ